MRKPAKWEIKEFVKLVDMIDFLKEKYRPFTSIAREAVRRGTIQESEIERLYQCFTVCVCSINIFEREFFPFGQTATEPEKWAWTLPNNITREKFLKKVNRYVQRKFKTPLY
jgi:hypothetical protein